MGKIKISRAKASKNRGKTPLNARGYTIVEVMIFLAVSSFMFVIAAAFVSGKQGQAEFKQGVNDLASQLETTINNVADGYYPAVGFVNCNASSASLVYSFVSQSSTSEGGNIGCVYMGQAIQFNSSPSDPSVYSIYTVVGRQFSTDAYNTTGPQDGSVGDLSDLPTTLSAAQPRTLRIGGEGYETSGGPVQDAVQTKTLNWGVQVTGVYSFSAGISNNSSPSYRNASGHNDNKVALGFMSTLPNSLGALAQSGSQSTTMLAFPGVSSARDIDEQLGGANIDDIAGGPIKPQPNVVICLKGGNGQIGSITIGGSGGNRLSVDTEFGNNVADVCTS